MKVKKKNIDLPTQKNFELKGQHKLFFLGLTVTLTQFMADLTMFCDVEILFCLINYVNKGSSVKVANKQGREKNENCGWIRTMS